MGCLGVFCFQEIKADFLPTGSMIEEVFGVESWNFKVTNKKKVQASTNRESPSLTPV